MISYAIMHYFYFILFDGLSLVIYLLFYYYLCFVFVYLGNSLIILKLPVRKLIHSFFLSLYYFSLLCSVVFYLSSVFSASLTGRLEDFPTSPTSTAKQEFLYVSSLPLYLLPIPLITIHTNWYNFITRINCLSKFFMLLVTYLMQRGCDNSLSNSAMVLN